MNRNAALLILLLVAPPNTFALRESQEGEYGAKFFDQLRSIFGRFRDADLERVFQMARPIRCSDLVTDKGEWREVAFFNENRKLGDWYRSSLAEVKNDLAEYVFSGLCRGERGPVQLTTKFPVGESISQVHTNAPVSAVFDTHSQAYTFDLPYLFQVSRTDADVVYSLNPTRSTDRYATDVINHWECKSVNAEDVTYQFLICRSSLVPRDGYSQTRRGSFGASAYSILSDGREASSTVKLTFGSDDDLKTKAEATASNTVPAPVSGRIWRSAASQARLTDVAQDEFRLRFAPETWKGRIEKPSFVSDGDFASGAPPNKDFCAWRPGAADQAKHLLDKETEGAVVYSLEFRKELQSVTSAVFEMQSDAGITLGVLQCFFPQSQNPADIAFSRWASMVGTNIALEVPAQ